MKKITLFLTFFACVISNAKAQQQYPNVSGSVLMQLEVDRIVSSTKDGIAATNSYVYSEPKFSLNFNRNWSVRTEWRLQQNNQLTTRDPQNPERYRTFFSNNRGVGLQDLGLLVEQLNIHFENDDMEFSAGKFDPKFGTGHNKSKRIGVFTSQFNEDYNLREKMGANLTALLENSKISVSTFFNDTTDLSKSAINDRGRAQQQNGLAGNTGTLSSYSITMEGSKPFGIENWNYNLGYRNLDVDKIANHSREKAYVVGSEYLYRVGNETYLVPFVEVVKIRNFTGVQGRNALYTTLATSLRYSNWVASISNLRRDIKRTETNTNSSSGRQTQISVGYKFGNNFTIDFSRAKVREDGFKGGMFGVVGSYSYKF